MTSYTGEQREKIMQMPAAVLLGSILADEGSAVVGMREFIAGEKFISEAGGSYAGNSLVESMAKNVNLPKLEEAIKPVLSIGNIDGVRSECQQKINDGLAVLGHDNEAAQFKAFLVALAEKVVNASGEGFFGNRGATVSANETAFVDQLKRNLNSA